MSDLCNAMDCSPPGFSAHGILQARTLEWVAMPSSRGSSQPANSTHVSYLSCIGSRFFTTSTTWEARNGGEIIDFISSVSFCFIYFLQETSEAQVRSLGWEDPLEEGMATHSSIFACRIPWTEEPGRPQSIGSHRVRHD